jgi:thymidylate kinase
MLELEGTLPFKYLYMGVNTESSNLALPTSRLVNRIRRRQSSARTGVPRARGRLWSAARLVHHLAEDAFRQLACWYYELSGRVVLCDRHFVFDYAPQIVVDSADAFDRRVRRWIFAHLFPRPDLVIFLDAPGEVLFKRKGDANPPELERRRLAYLSQGGRVSNFVRVDATRPLREVYDQVFDHILSFRQANSSKERLGRLMDKGRSRYVYKMLDAFTTAGLTSHPIEGTSPPSSRMRSSAFELVRRVVGTAEAVVPGTIRWIRASLIHATHLPCKGGVELIGFGSGSTVFLLKNAELQPTPSPEQVLKIYRRSLGRSLPALLDLAEEFRTKYRTICQWYEEGSFVHPTHFAVLHAPMLDQPSVACFQPYIAGGMTDFLERKDEELLSLLASHDRLRDQFSAFAECTLRTLEHERRCVDLLGHGNLALVHSGGEYRLCLLDFGIFDLATVERNAPRVAARVTRQMERIRSLQAAARDLDLRANTPAVGAAGR